MTSIPYLKSIRNRIKLTKTTSVAPIIQAFPVYVHITYAADLTNMMTKQPGQSGYWEGSMELDAQLTVEGNDMLCYNIYRRSDGVCGAELVQATCGFAGIKLY